MGGDGGVVATNRRYMRGAGTADTTGDHNQATCLSLAEIKVNQEREALETLSTCALSKTRLQSTDTIVACRYGRLYLKEAVVQALLRRRQSGEAGTSSPTTAEEEQALAHIKKLSDLYAVRGVAGEDNKESLVWMCPITGKSLTGRVPAAILLVPGNPDSPNLVSEFAHKQLSSKDMETEYGPIERKIRLAPTPDQLAQVQAELEEERSKKKNKKKGTLTTKSDEKDSMISTTGKRKRPEDETTGKASSLQVSSTTSSIAKEIQSRVDSALESNQVLSSLFVDKKGKSS